MSGKTKNKPLLYYRTREDIEVYRKAPVRDKLKRLEEQMRFFHLARSEKAKRIRDEMKKGNLG
ncbi:MAG: hypothetical protein HY887_04460 [Deltaproteobacteria bacterium]|nr:hypothetical protein [Deltaproteobacteria bacterium]